MFFLILVLVVGIIVCIVAFSGQEDQPAWQPPSEPQPVPQKQESVRDDGSWNDMSFEELKRAALEHVHHLCSFPYTEAGCNKQLRDIADYRQRVAKMESAEVRRAYNEWLDFAEDRTNRELKKIAERRITERNAKRIPKP